MKIDQKQVGSTASEIKQLSFNLPGPFGNLHGVIDLCRSQEGNRKVLLMVHGFRGTLEGGGRAGILAQAAAQYLQVVRFNFSDCQLLEKQVQELQYILAYVQQRWQPEKLYLLGRSLGGATAIITESLPGALPLSGLILWSTPNDLPATFKQVLGAKNYERLLSGQDLQLSDERGPILVQAAFVRGIQNYDLTVCLHRQRKRPLLILHGTADAIVAPGQAQANYEAAFEPKELIMIPGGDHSFTTKSEVAAQAVLHWLKEQLDK